MPKHDSVKMQKLLDKKQANHSPNQVKTPEEIIKGKIYKVHQKSSDQHYRVEVTKAPFNYEGSLKIEYMRYSDLPQDSRPEEKFLGDLGIVPYDNGLWNQSNWLEKI